jgi:glycosyltransferase involved in cell wall biosynthesis
VAKFLFYDHAIINLLSKKEQPSGGAAVQSYAWIRGLLAMGHKVQVITACNGGVELRDECRDIRLIPLYDPTKGVRWFRWFYYRIPFLFRTIKTAAPDYLYQGVPGWPTFILGVITKLLNIKLIFRISNDFIVDRRYPESLGIIRQYFKHEGLRLSYCVLCQNDYQYEIIRKAFPRKIILKIRNPIVLADSSNLIKPGPRNYIAWLGIYQYQKNLKLLYEIASVLHHEQFFIAGKEIANCDDDTLFYVAELKKLTNVHFVGFLNRDAVLPFVSHARFLLNTSHYEGFSNTFLEAMCVGTPIMSSTRVNPDAIISKYQLGIVYDSVSDLEAQYSRMTETKYLAMSKNVIEYVHREHDYQVVSRKLTNSLNIN